MNLIQEIEKSKLKEELPSYKSGDSVTVSYTHLTLPTKDSV